MFHGREPVLQFLFKFPWFAVAATAAVAHVSLIHADVLRGGARGDSARATHGYSALCPKLEW